MGDFPTSFPTTRQRVDEVRAKLPIAEVIERHVKLSGSGSARKRRGKCPFHGSNSPSFAVDSGGSAGDGRAKCWGCGWSGHVVDFVKDIMGLPFIEALKECEREAGIAPSGGATASGYSSAGRGPIRREKAPVARVDRQCIESLDMGRALWRRARPDYRAVRRYFAGRGVPECVLDEDRLREFRFLAECPCTPWLDGESWAKRGAPVAPAVMAMVREPRVFAADGLPPRLELVPVGVHVTYLDPDGTGTMLRRKPWAVADDPDPWLPKRRMLGPVGRGCVVLGRYDCGAALFVGEGNETVLSGMGLADAEPSGATASLLERRVVGIAALSLDNLQGQPMRWKGGIWPLWRIEPDPEHQPFLIPGHVGPVTVLVDSDMSPLRGMKDRKTGEFLGEALVERKGGPIVRRAITGAERAHICAELAVKGWRAELRRSGSGAHVEALRAPMGMDFNDAARELMATRGMERSALKQRSGSVETDALKQRSGSASKEAA